LQGHLILCCTLLDEPWEWTSIPTDQALYGGRRVPNSATIEQARSASHLLSHLLCRNGDWCSGCGVDVQTGTRTKSSMTRAVLWYDGPVGPWPLAEEVLLWWNLAGGIEPVNGTGRAQRNRLTLFRLGRKKNVSGHCNGR